MPVWVAPVIWGGGGEGWRLAVAEPFEIMKNQKAKPIRRQWQLTHTASSVATPMVSSFWWQPAQTESVPVGPLARTNTLTGYQRYFSRHQRTNHP